MQGVLSHAELSLTSVRKDLEQLQQARLRAQQETAAQVWVGHSLDAASPCSTSLGRVSGTCGLNADRIMHVYI